MVEVGINFSTLGAGGLGYVCHVKEMRDGDGLKKGKNIHVFSRDGGTLALHFSDFPFSPCQGNCRQLMEAGAVVGVIWHAADRTATLDLSSQSWST